MAGTTPSAEDLLAHGEWLHQLARALVGDAAAADIVQDTFEVALAEPPKREGPLRPWLGGVARNVARMATRGRIRREKREEAAAAPVVGVVATDVPSPETLVARAEMHQRVSRMVLELPEPLRATVLLRFFEGMSAAEIARAQGVPAATVRGRLKDALDLIRLQLDRSLCSACGAAALTGGAGPCDREHARNRNAWAMLLAPLSHASPPGAAAVVAGGLIVKTGVKVLVALVVVALAVVGTRLAGLWGGSEKPAQTAKTPTPQGSGDNTVKVTPPATPSTAGSARTLPPVYDNDPKGTLRLEGQVIDEKDAPVAGASVAIDANPPIVVTTEADGGFVFEQLIRRDYRIEATQGDRYGGPARLRLGDKTEPVTIRMRRGGQLEVVVTDTAGGKPVANADVEFRSTLTWTAKTNAEGIATLAGVGATWAPLAVRAQGYAPAAMMVGASGTPDHTERVALALSKGAAIVGRVIDEAGKPVVGARVVPTSASEPLPVVDPRRDGVLTTANGAFTIPVVAAGTWRLTASHGDAAPTTSVPITVDGTNARSGIELQLTAGAIVKGTVKDKAGHPVAGADVAVVAQGFVFWRGRRQAFTSSDGTFSITGLERRSVDVVAFHESGASAIAPADLATNREHTVAITLDITGAIIGTVVDSKGAPVADAQVVAEPDWSGGVAERAQWLIRGVQETVADQSGAFTFHGLPDGTYRVRAARPGASEIALALSSGTTAKPSAAPINVTVPAEARAIGNVQLEGGKAPVAFLLELGDTNRVPFASADGSFTLPAPAGTYPLTITGPGFVSLTKQVTLADGKDTDLGTITVQPGRSISGRVLDAQGVPVAKATVAAGMLLTGGGAELYIKDESIGAQDTQTDDNGRFILSGFPPASVTILAGKQGTGRSSSIRVPASTESAVVDLVLAPTTTLAGKVTKGGQPLADTVIIANPIGAVASNFFVTTGPDGTFALDALAPGPYVVYPMLGGGGNRPKDIYTRRADLVLGKKTEIAIDATPGAITLAVTVKTDKGAPVPMAQLITIAATIDPTSIDELRDGTNMPFGDGVIPIYMRGIQDGAAQIEGMKQGPHTLCVVGGDPRDPSTAKMKCQQSKLTNADKQAVALTVPAAWIDAPK
jgi:RNA polymerase sigma-70 factor (ECF subfamily)